MIKPTIAFFLLTLGVVCCAGADSTDDPQPEASLAGVWHWSFVMPEGTTNKPSLKLWMEGERLMGTTSFRRGGATPVTNLTFDGRQLRFQVERERDGNPIWTTYSGVWASNSIAGTIESDWLGAKESYPWTAMRAHAGAEGVWRWTNSVPGGRGGRPRGVEAKVELEQSGDQLKGKLLSRSGRGLPITNGVAMKGVIYFEIERPVQDDIYVTKYKGKQVGDIITGTTEAECDEGVRTNKWTAFRDE